MRTPTGSVTRRGDAWLARITWTDRDSGKRRERSQFVPTKRKGLDLVHAWRQSWEDTGTVPPAETIAAQVPPPRRTDGRHTFDELAAHYREKYAVPPVYNGDRKIRGQRSWRTTLGHVTHLEAAFAGADLEAITWPRIDDLRSELLAGKTARGDDRSVAYTNRVLSTLRRMLHVARQREWMTVDPFSRGDALVNQAHEVERTRILEPAEETALLAHCTAQQKRLHLRAIIVTAIETGMREDEILRLRLEDVDWQTNTIHVRTMHTKTLEKRDVPLTRRLRDELVAWLHVRPTSDRLFGIRNRLRASWDTVRDRAAKDCPSLAADPITFHDLRHTAATRMILAGVDVSIVGRILGHKTTQTTKRYVNVSKAVAAGVARKMDQKARPPRKARAIAAAAAPVN
ncbi:MAG: site-specific integrase [Thermoanaerobaculia bacterium]